jgi:hypothetical protein
VLPSAVEASAAVPRLEESDVSKALTLIKVRASVLGLGEGDGYFVRVSSARR